MKLYIKDGDKNDETPEFKLYLEKSQWGISVMSEDEEGCTQYLVSITVNGTVVRHDTIAANGFDVDSEGRLIEEDEDNY